MKRDHEMTSSSIHMCEQDLNYVEKVKFDQVNMIYSQRVDLK